jgi:FtsP/CotA-like multicopper oxidase with cupredoxin domain/plastocyanin
LGVVSALALAALVTLPGRGDPSRASALPPPPTLRATATVVIPPGGAVTGYSPSSVSVEQGGVLRVVNNDDMTHTVTSEAVGPEGDPLFYLILPSHTTQTLTLPSTMGAGQYPFYCSLHPSMRGTLVVTGEPGPAPKPPRFEQALRVPPVLSGSDITIDIRKASVKVMPHGPWTRMWTYGGTYPGPTIKRPTGATTKVTFVNDLPTSAGALTVHQHGGHHSSADDGQPTRYLIRAGAPRTYTYPLVDDGRPERAGFRFYHDHRMGVTARNNWRGLQGMFLVTDPREDRLRLPRGAYDVPLMVVDRSLTTHNQLTDPFPGPDMLDWMTGPHAPPNDATVGTKILVNGQFAPFLRVKPGRYRLRLLNASLFSAYNFALSDGRPFVQVGTGSGLLPHPVVRQDILLGPAQRADVVVDFRGRRDQNVILDTVPRNDGVTGTGTRSASIMQFRVRGHAHQRSHVPDRLRPSPRLAVPGKVAMTWTFDLTDHGDHGSFWSINGKMFDPQRVDHRVTLGSIERWRLRNASDETHYVHLHEEQWLTVSRDGRRPPPWERGLEDTWRLDPGEYVDVAARFTDYPGVFMLHCHMLDHEDHGMMAQFEVVEDSTAPTKPSSQVGG